MVKPVCGKIPGKKKKKNNIDHLHLWFFHFLVGYAAWDQNQIDWYVITRLFFFFTRLYHKNSGGSRPLDDGYSPQLLSFSRLVVSLLKPCQNGQTDPYTYESLTPTKIEIS